MKATNFLFQIPGSDDIWDLDQLEGMPKKPEVVVILDNKHRGFRALGKIPTVLALSKFR